MILSTIIFTTCSIGVVQAKSQYIVDILEVDWNVTSKNNFDMKWEITRPSRGVYAISGIADFKEDINTDKTKTWTNIYYSTNGVSYMLTPFRYPPGVFTDYFNVIYKNYLMATVKKCCENPVHIEIIFVSPLTKRRITCNNCLIQSDNLPSNMRLGYYKVESIATGDLAFSFNALVKLDVE